MSTELDKLCGNYENPSTACEAMYNKMSNAVGDVNMWVVWGFPAGASCCVRCSLFLLPALTGGPRTRNCPPMHECGKPPTQ
jgi:hypothetical protein